MKPQLVLYAPIDTLSGYGSRSRDLAHALVKLKEPEFDVRFISCRWGACSPGVLKHDNPKDKILLDRILQDGKMTTPPAVWIMCTVPNEMQKIGTIKNILITAGMESTICLPEWIEGCNRADLVITSSEHAKKVFETSMFEKINNQTKQVESHIKLSTKCEVLFEGVDLSVYHNTKGESTFDLSGIDESFSFLTVGSWLQGEFGQDRKNISGLVKIFLESFKNRKVAPALILKTHGAAPSVIDRENILDLIESIRRSVDAKTLPNIYFMHGELTDDEMNQLYNHPKVKAFALLTKGEGFGRPLLEFSLTQKPIITTNFGGQNDFLNPEFTIMVGGNVEKIHPSAIVKDIFHPESSWLNINPAEASHMLKEVYDNYDKHIDGAKRQAYRSKTQFSIEEMEKKLGSILDTNIPKMSVPVTVKLPMLKKTPQL